MLKIKAKTKTVQLDGEFSGGEVTVRSNAPMSVILRLDKLKGGEDFDALLDLIPEIVTAWNFTDEAGAPVPVSPDGIRALPVDLFQAVMAAFNESITVEATVSPN